MAFLRLGQVKKVVDALTNFFKSGKPDKKPKGRIFYALQKSTGIVHFILESMIAVALEESPDLEIRPIPKDWRGWKLTLDKNYTRTRNWGTSFNLRQAGGFNANKIVYELVVNGSESEEIITSDLPQGRRFNAREEFLSRMASDINIGDFIAMIGISLDPDFYSRVKFELKEALQTVQLKLAPIEMAVAL